MEKITCALIGVGYWGAKLKSYIEENPNFNLKYACNSKSDLHKVWNDREVTAVINATPNAFHYEITKQALLHNKHVLTEKPLALTTIHCLELKKKATERNLIIQTNYIFNFSKALQKAQEWIQEGKIGRLLVFEACVRHLGRFGGGSVYWLLGSHMLAVLDIFFPITSLHFERRDILTYKDEVETGIISFCDDLKGQIVISLNCPIKETKVTLYGEDGTIIYNPNLSVPLSITSYKRLKWVKGNKLPKKTTIYVSNETNNLRYTIETFYDVLTNKKKSNLDTSVAITRILEEIQR